MHRGFAAGLIAGAAREDQPEPIRECPSHPPIANLAICDLPWLVAGEAIVGAERSEAAARPEEPEREARDDVGLQPMERLADRHEVEGRRRRVELLGTPNDPGN